MNLSCGRPEKRGEGLDKSEAGVDHRSGEELSDDAPDSDRRSVPSELYQKISEALKSGNEVRVVDAAADILGKNQNDIKALNSLAMFHFSKGRAGIARLILNRALEVAKNDSTLLNNLGLILLSEGETAAALELFKKGLAKNKSHPELEANLGSLYLQTGDYEKSRIHLGKAYNRLKSNNEVAIDYGVALRGVGEFSMADEVYQSVLDREKENLAALVNTVILRVDYMKKTENLEGIIKKIKFLSPETEVLSLVNDLEMRIRKMKK